MIQKICKKAETLTEFLKKAGFGYYQSKKLLQQKEVKVNGIRRQEDVNLSVGDEVEIYAEPQKQLPILFEDEHLLVVDKPAGIEVTGDCGVESVLCEAGKRCYAVHRLDRNTCGVLLLAKTPAMKVALEKAFYEKRLQKVYLAVLVGVPPRQAVWKDFLFKDAKKKRVYVSKQPKKGALPIETHYRVLDQNGALALAEVKLITGRTHQIRAHMAFYGYPVLGDGKYGDYEKNKKYGQKIQQLCCKRLKIEQAPGLEKYRGKEFQSPHEFSLQTYKA